MNFSEIIKEKLILSYQWASYVFFGLNALAYLVCCIIARGQVGPVAYIGWLNYCCQWRAV
jgi:hypothetical protein